MIKQRLESHDAEHRIKNTTIQLRLANETNETLPFLGQGFGKKYLDDPNETSNNGYSDTLDCDSEQEVRQSCLVKELVFLTPRIEWKCFNSAECY